MTVKTLKSLRTDESFQAYCELVQKTAYELEVESPSLPRKRSAPRRYDSKGNEDAFPHHVEDYYRPFFFEGIDRIVNGIEMRFEQPGFQTYKQLQNVLLKPANKESYDDDIEFITQLYGSDLNLQQLKLHLNILSSNLPQSSIAYYLSSIVEFIKKLSPIQKALISQVHCLVSLILVMPATNATSERSFSALR